MKRLLLSCLFIFTLCTVYAQDKQAILKLLADQQQAWNNADVDGFMQGYWKSDSLMFVGKTGPVYGWQTTLDNYKKRYPGKAAMGQLAFKVIKLQLLDPENAFMLGGWHLTRASGDIGGYFTLWFRKIDGGWKIVCDHTSSNS
ncbi:Ketosteroid isomerase homolog [Mucilaginibacter mallensis]|uniref:Ketosteroid isomerase homolog n=1 Tax=Mucilaginibacter mallensis TaxID=652787 RepID=A0A1H1RLC8_MUCMA|nr:nuclear transport factor 2 family protein [Mucilaginibacter mallensis]SDS36514.1 Ketosteroid isomerase homolog [Mucilaginibacter mallensis]